MTPDLALLLCCVFCVWVFRKDAQWHPGLSPALWLPVLWIWRSASRDIGFWFHGGDPAAADGTLYDPVFFTVCTIIGWGVLLRRNLNWSEILRSNVWLFLFFGYMAISIFWTPDAFVGFKRWFRACGDLTIVLIVATNPGGQLEGLLTVLRRGAYLLVPFSIVLAKYFPDLGRSPGKHWQADEWIGVATQKNDLGMLCMVMGLWLMWEFWHLRENREALPEREFKIRRGVVALYAAMTLYLFNGGGTARSMTSIVTLLIGVALFWQLATWLENPSRFWQRIGVILGIWIVLQPGSQLLFGKSLYDMTLEAMGRNPTLTDRTMLWHDCFKLGMQQPILGAGYMGFWTDKVATKIAVDNTNGPTEAHNGYLEVFLQLGAVGLMLFLPVIFSSLAKAWRLMRVDFDQGRFYVAILVCMLVHNYTESGFPRPNYLTWFVFLLAGVSGWRNALATSELPDPDENEFEPADNYEPAQKTPAVET